jgi:hypothetical protein
MNHVIVNRIAGVEYVISEKIFKTLPQEEKQLWHSHEFEVSIQSEILQFSIMFKNTE